MSESINFDRAVEFYDSTRGFPPGRAADAAALIARAAGFTADQHVLEIGIGTGRMALPLSTHINAVFGADISTGMMRVLLDKRTTERVFPAGADAARLPYAANIFDGVLVSHVFHLVADLPGVISELQRVIKPSGRLAHCWNTDDGALYDLRQAWKEGAGRSSDARWQASYDVLGDNGWSKQSEQTLEYVHPQAPMEIIQKFRDRIWSSTWNLTDQEHANGLAAMLAHAQASYADLNMPVDVTHTFHVAVYTPPTS